MTRSDAEAYAAPQTRSDPTDRNATADCRDGRRPSQPSHEAPLDAHPAAANRTPPGQTRNDSPGRQLALPSTLLQQVDVLARKPLSQRRRHMRPGLNCQPPDHSVLLLCRGPIRPPHPAHSDSNENSLCCGTKNAARGTSSRQNSSLFADLASIHPATRNDGIAPSTRTKRS